MHFCKPIAARLNSLDQALDTADRRCILPLAVTCQSDNWCGHDAPYHLEHLNINSCGALASHKEENTVLYWAFIFLIVALVAGVLGFSGIAGISAQIAWILFIVGMILFVVFLILGRRPPPL